MKNLQPRLLDLHQTTELLNDPLKPFGTEYHNNSDKYQQVSTKQVIQILLDKGFRIQSTYNTRSKQGPMAKHQVNFVHPNYCFGSTFLGISFLNSHNASSSYQFRFFINELICSNGMAISTDVFKLRRVPHRGKDIQEKVIKNIEEITAKFDKLSKVIEKMNSIKLSKSQIFNLTKEVTHEVLNNVTNLESIDYKSAIRPRHYQQNTNSLWHIYNRLQEAAIRGGIKYKTYKEITDSNILEFKRGTTSRVKSIDKINNLNEIIFNKALKLIA